MGLFDKLFGARDQNKPPTHDQFAQMLIESIRQAGWQGEIHYDREQFRLLVPGEDGIKLFLSNTYQEYRAAPEEQRAGVLRKVTRGWFASEKAIPDDYEDVKPDLLPVVRARAFFESTRLLAQCEGQKAVECPYQIVGEGLAASLVYDLPETMRSIGDDDLARWGVTFYEALEAAMENLRRLPHSFVGPEAGEGVFLSTTNDYYDASRLLLLDMIWQLPVKGDHVAMVPNRGTLIVTGAEDAEGLKGLIALAKEALQQPRVISALAVRLDGDEWVPWLPDASHPSYPELRTLQVQSYGQDYNEQKELLDKLHEKTGQDIFVASFSMVERKGTRELQSYCVWSKNVLSLLPRTDLVAFNAEGEQPTLAPWDRVVEVAGDSMQPLDMYPPRLRVENFPTAEQRAAMGNVLE